MHSLQSDACSHCSGAVDLIYDPLKWVLLISKKLLSCVWHLLWHCTIHMLDVSDDSRLDIPLPEYVVTFRSGKVTNCEHLTWSIVPEQLQPDMEWCLCQVVTSANFLCPQHSAPHLSYAVFTPSVTTYCTGVPNGPLRQCLLPRMSAIITMTLLC